MTAPAPPEARRAVETRFCADLARRHPGTVWHVEHPAETEPTDDDPVPEP